MVATPDCPDIVSVFYGPYILAALSEEEEMMELPDEEKLSGMEWVPFCCVDKESYHLYFKKNERW